MRKITNPKYYEKFVATTGFGACGNDVHKVIKRAEKKCKHPMVFYNEDPKIGRLEGLGY